ncbi:MAG: SDR family oxidoreductase [Verrucomicrobia bacterium]|nr:SDR family oxidoreductase [Verrucomicrobiota bacterium]MBU4247125.1 SDR family oxidoreductase [Verrucomicrobiota bacterium]MBU4429492.1 SDR family oxidoreductase [Verrucomicrobiota bacterium]MCG2680594.1 SDR family oxidoreductase [Kiritimatiellia bacterium]
MPIDLSGRAVLVTGATGQLGRVMVRTLACAGADIIVHYNSNVKQAKTLVKEIRNLNREAIAVNADVTDRKSVDALRKRAEKELRAPDIVVANAVIQYQWMTVLQQTLTDYENQYLSSVKQSVLLAQTFVPGMIDRKWGRVIGINTECSMQYSKSTSAYIAGKRGMDGVLRVLAREVGEHGITVNQVAPGWTISEDHPESDASLDYRARVPLKRRGTDREIANVVAFLASDLASFITGAYIPVCGGNVMPAI